MKKEKWTGFFQILGYSWWLWLQLHCLSEIRQHSWQHQWAKQVCQRRNTVKTHYSQNVNNIFFQIFKPIFLPNIVLLPYGLIFLFEERLFSPVLLLKYSEISLFFFFLQLGVVCWFFSPWLLQHYDLQ